MIRGFDAHILMFRIFGEAKAIFKTRVAVTQDLIREVSQLAQVTDVLNMGARNVVAGPLVRVGVVDKPTVDRLAFV